MVTPRPRKGAVTELRPGPPPLREGEGVAEMASTYPDHTLIVDDGVFMYLWRIVHAKYTIANNPHGIQGTPEYRKLLERALDAFDTTRGVQVAAAKKKAPPPDAKVRRRAPVTTKEPRKISRR